MAEKNGAGQRSLRKALNDALHPDELKRLQKMKARIEFVGDIEDLRELSEQLKELSRKDH